LALEKGKSKLYLDEEIHLGWKQPECYETCLRVSPITLYAKIKKHISPFSTIIMYNIDIKENNDKKF
jgi:hypothetical protein